MLINYSSDYKEAHTISANTPLNTYIYSSLLAISTTYTPPFLSDACVADIVDLKNYTFFFFSLNQFEHSNRTVFDCRKLLDRAVGSLVLGRNRFNLICFDLGGRRTVG